MISAGRITFCGGVGFCCGAVVPEMVIGLLPVPPDIVVMIVDTGGVGRCEGLIAGVNIRLGSVVGFRVGESDLVRRERVRRAIGESLGSRMMRRLGQREPARLITC